MPVATQLQTNFTSGEIDPNLKMRSDINHYVNGAEKLRNVFVMPQGGVKRRPGLEYLATTAVDDIVDTIRLVEFVFSFSQSFLFVFRTAAAARTVIEIYDTNGALDDTLTFAADVVPWGHTDLDDLKWTQFLDTMIIFHPDHEPYQVKRVSAGVWSGADVVFENTPTFDFDDGGGDIVAGVNMVWQVHLFDVNDDRQFSLLLDGIETETIIFDKAPDDSVAAANMQAALRALDITSATGITVAKNATASSGTLLVYDVIFGGNDGEKDWDLQPGYVSIDTDGVVDTTIGTQGKLPGAPVWSNTRGWPICGAV